jgi:hypothetical protein
LVCKLNFNKAVKTKGREYQSYWRQIIIIGWQELDYLPILNMYWGGGETLPYMLKKNINESQVTYMHMTISCLMLIPDDSFGSQKVRFYFTLLP